MFRRPDVLMEKRETMEREALGGYGTYKVLHTVVKLFVMSHEAYEDFCGEEPVTRKLETILFPHGNKVKGYKIPKQEVLHRMNRQPKRRREE